MDDDDDGDDDDNDDDLSGWRAIAPWTTSSLPATTDFRETQASDPLLLICGHNGDYDDEDDDDDSDDDDHSDDDFKWSDPSIWSWRLASSWPPSEGGSPSNGPSHIKYLNPCHKISNSLENSVFQGNFTLTALLLIESSSKLNSFFDEFNRFWGKIYEFSNFKNW